MPPAAIKPRSQSIEHRSNLLDVDAFLSYAQIVIGDSNHDRVVGNPDRIPQQAADGSQQRPSYGAQRPIEQADQNAGDDQQANQQQLQAENPPAMAFCQLRASSHAAERSR